MKVGGGEGEGRKFPSFLPHPLPALLLRPFFARSLTIFPRSLLLNRTETLATQATVIVLILTFLTCQQYIAPAFKRPGDTTGSTYRTLEHLNFAVSFITDIVTQISYARVTCKSSFYLWQRQAKVHSEKKKRKNIPQVTELSLLLTIIKIDWTCFFIKSIRIPQVITIGIMNIITFKSW